MKDDHYDHLISYSKHSPAYNFSNIAYNLTQTVGLASGAAVAVGYLSQIIDKF